MRLLATLLLISALGCGKKKVETVAEGPPPHPHPDLVCPENTYGIGKAPPNGFKVWCVRETETGTQVAHGGVIEWHPNEKRSFAGQHVNGKESGTWMYWFETGKPKQQGTYVQGVKEGLWTTFHPTGQRASQGEYVAGRENGEWTYWSEDNQTRTEGAYQLGDRDGTWLDYGPDNRPTRERTYRGGRLINQREL